MKTTDQLISDIVALMADVWLAACNRRVIATPLDPKSPKVSVMDMQGHAILFGPASGDECRLFVHRMAALDVLKALGTAQISEAALFMANNSKAPVLNG